VAEVSGAVLDIPGENRLEESRELSSMSPLRGVTATAGLSGSSSSSGMPSSSTYSKRLGSKPLGSKDGREAAVVELIT
jgi:hypothetical protein